MRRHPRAASERVAALRDDPQLDQVRQTALLWTCMMVLLAIWMFGVANSTRAGGSILLLAGAILLVGLLWVRRAPI